MLFPFDLDLPILFYLTGHTVVRSLSALRQSQKPIPVHLDFVELSSAVLTPAQAQFLTRWDTKLQAINYRPVCTYRTDNYGRNLMRTYVCPADCARCTVMVVEVKVNSGLEAVHHSCTVFFTTEYADGRRLVTRNMKLRSLMDQPPNRIIQECPNVTNPEELKRRHDLRAAGLGVPLLPATDAKIIFERSARDHQAFNKYQSDHGILKLLPGGHAYTPTDKMYWRGVRNHYNPLAQRFSWKRLLPCVLVGAGLPLASLLKLAPAAATTAAVFGLSTLLPIEQIANVAAYLTAGAIVGYVLDRSSLTWTFLLTYVSAHAVLGWTFGPLPFSTLAALASFYARQAKHRRRLILIPA